MGRTLDLTGKRYERLYVIKRYGSTEQKKSTWLCKCNCGNTHIAIGSKLKQGEVTSCGCFRREKTAIHNRYVKYRHGKIQTRLYHIWHGMVQRIFDENSANYGNYGKRGISMCQEWKEDFRNFEEWAIKSGYEDSLSIDRIDNEKGYFPNNCKWSTSKEQSNNRRSSRILEYNGEKKTMKGLAEERKINYSTLKWRIGNGWSVKRALETPTRKG